MPWVWLKVPSQTTVIYSCLEGRGFIRISSIRRNTLSCTKATRCRKILVSVLYHSHCKRGKELIRCNLAAKLAGARREMLARSTKHEKALAKFAISKVRETCQQPALPKPVKIFYLCANIQQCNTWPGANQHATAIPKPKWALTFYSDPHQDGKWTVHAKVNKVDKVHSETKIQHQDTLCICLKSTPCKRFNSLYVLPSFSCSNEPFKTDLPCFHNWKWLHWRNTRYTATYTIRLGRILVFAQEDPPTTNTPPFSLKVCQDVYPHERFAKANYIRERPQERRHSYP